MDLLEAIQKRHAVRKYTTQPIPADIITALRDEITACQSGRRTAHTVDYQ